MKPFRFLLLALVLTAWSAPALADCIANGKRYSTGTVLGSYECQPDGRWRRTEHRR